MDLTRATCGGCGAALDFLPGTLAVRCSSCGAICHVSEPRTLASPPSGPAPAPVHVTVNLSCLQALPSAQPATVSQAHLQSSAPAAPSSTSAPLPLGEAESAFDVIDRRRGTVGFCKSAFGVLGATYVFVASATLQAEPSVPVVTAIIAGVSLVLFFWLRRLHNRYTPKWREAGMTLTAAEDREKVKVTDRILARRRAVGG